MPDKNKLILGTNDDTYIAADDAGNIILQHEGGNRVSMSNTSITPASNEQIDLGSATNKFKDLYLSSDSIFIGNTKLSSDPTTGALSTVVADEQGQFTAPAAAVGGSSSFYDWKGSTKNIAANDPDNIFGTISTLSMESLYDRMVIQGNFSNVPSTEIIWGNYRGNPDSDQYVDKSPMTSNSFLRTGKYHYKSAFITDENGDDLSAFLVDKMEEENSPILNFEFSICARLEVKDPVKAAHMKYFQGGQYNNLTNVTTVPLWNFTQKKMYALKCASDYDSTSNGHTRGIKIGSMSTADYITSGTEVAFWKETGRRSTRYDQSAVFQWYNYIHHEHTMGGRHLLDMDMQLHNPGYGMTSTDPAISSATTAADLAGYFDLQDGIVFDMFVRLT